MIGTVISHYKIIEKLGEGGMGVVYKAEDLKLTRTVALKFLPHGLDANEPERARFLQEARAAAILNHPNICTVYDIQEHDGQQFIVMEHVEGKTLRERISEGRLPIGVAVGYAIQIGEALLEAHSKGIVHRDIKADNIMVNTKNQIKVMDFGLAKLRGSLKLTKTSSTVGTLAYMAPEQIQGGEVDARSDIFSFGVVLYEMLTGHLPFRGEHEAAMMYSILNAEPESLQMSLPDAPSELLHTIFRALEKDPEERYQTVHDMLIDLRRLKKDSSRVSRQHLHETAAPETRVPTSIAGVPERWKKWLWLGAAGIVVVGAFLAFLLVPKSAVVKLNPHRSFRTLSVPFEQMGHPSLSKDGNWVVFPASDENGKFDVYWMNTTGGEPSRITREESYLVNVLDISPEAGVVAYDCLKESDHPYEIRLVPLQGGPSRTIADTGYSPRWSPDGKRIAYLRSGAMSWATSISGKLEIWSIRPDGTDNRLELLDSVSSWGSAASYCWSPDGASIAWVREYAPDRGAVMVRELATGSERQLTSDSMLVTGLTWATNENIVFASNRSGQTNLWVVPSGGGEATQVTNGTVPIVSARTSFDNKKLVYLQNELFPRLWISALDGSHARQVSFDLDRVERATLSPDGKQIASVIGSVDPGRPENQLVLMDREGRNRRVLTSGEQTIDFCRWSLDGKWLAYASRPLQEPWDSNRVYLIQPSNPGAPKLLARGSLPAWLDSENLVLFRWPRTWRYSIKGGTPSQVFQDSTYAVSLQSTNLICFYDVRKGREGQWVVSIDSSGREVGEARRLPSVNYWREYPFSPDYRFLLYKKQGGNELWRVWLAGGKQERMGNWPSGFANISDVSMDGKEILWVKQGQRAKLGLIENLFE